VSELLAARAQMGLTLGFHIIFACFGIGFPVLMLIAEWRYLRTKDEVWKNLAKRWAKAFAVLFAVGAVSGTVLSFELGLLWPEFMGRFGSVIGVPFTLEGFAFFLEAIFVGIYLYSWDRLPPKVHWWTGVPIAISGAASAAFVIAVNGWMNIPQGFEMEAGKVVEVRPLEVLFNPAAATMTLHMLVSAYQVCGFSIAAFYAWRMLRGHTRTYEKRALALGLALALPLAPIQAMVGHSAAALVARTQPVKLAAMEGQFETQRGAPLRIGGWPDEEARETRYAIELPGMLSWMCFGDMDAEIVGLNDVDPRDHPPVPVVHAAFQTMVGIGSALIGLAFFVGGTLLLKRRLPSHRLFLWAVVAAAPASVIAMEAGWIVTEVGRQPWVVQGVLRTEDAVTTVGGGQWLILATLAVYGVLTAGTILTLRALARRPLELPDSEVDHAS
jgi:cytochrome d ubiquinol oxidase subunit I